RIKKIYGRLSEVIYPPVDTMSFKVEKEKLDYYIVASRMVPYKKIDLIARAFSLMKNRKLLIAGDGPEMRKVKRAAAENVEILGYLPQDELNALISRAKAFVIAADEDFGITAVEAQASGTPVIAFGRGGSLETVIPNETGIF